MLKESKHFLCGDIETSDADDNVAVAIGFREEEEIEWQYPDYHVQLLHEAGIGCSRS